MLTDRGFSAPTNFDPVAVIPAGDPVALADAVGRAGSHVVIAAPAALKSELLLMTSVAAGRWPEIRIARMVSPHAPLAILSALALARQVTDEPALGYGLARASLQRSWSGAWLSSLAKLVEPAPTMGQHVRSLLPGAGFLVRQAPRPAVLDRIRADDFPTADIGRVLLVQDTGIPAVVRRRLVELPQTLAVRELVVPGDWTCVYGTDAGQLALVPAEPVQLLPAVTPTCDTCGLRQMETVCPFCRTVVRTPAGPAPDVPAPDVRSSAAAGAPGAARVASDATAAIAAVGPTGPGGAAA